jgi:hypothetical protein
MNGNEGVNFITLKEAGLSQGFGLTDGEARWLTQASLLRHQTTPPLSAAADGLQGFKQSAAKNSPRGGKFAGAGANSFAEAAADCPPILPLAEPRSASAFLVSFCLRAVSPSLRCVVRGLNF